MRRIARHSPTIGPFLGCECKRLIGLTSGIRCEPVAHKFATGLNSHVRNY